MKLKLLTTLALALLIVVVAKGDIVIYPGNIVSVTPSYFPGCPGGYAGYANYTKTIANGWGYATNGTSHTATDTNRNNTKVQFVGHNGDSGCAPTSVTVPDPTYSQKYRFTVYFTNSTPVGTNYPLLLHGFDP